MKLSVISISLFKEKNNFTKYMCIISIFTKKAYLRIVITTRNIFSLKNVFCYQANCLKRIQAVASLPSEVIGSEGAWCDWPSSGSVNFTHVKLPGCVHKAAIECDIPPGEKARLKTPLLL